MRPRDCFALAVRLVGLGASVWALFDAFYAFTKIFGFETTSKLPLSTDLAAMIFFVVLAAVGFLGAEKLADFTYGASTER